MGKVLKLGKENQPETRGREVTGEGRYVRSNRHRFFKWRYRAFCGTVEVDSSKKPSLEKSQGYRFDICIITELKNRKSDRINLPGFDAYIANGYNQERRGAGIFIRKNIKMQVIDLEHCLREYDACGMLLIRLIL